jgi:hypothetical protein
LLRGKQFCWQTLWQHILSKSGTPRHSSAGLPGEKDGGCTLGAGESNTDRNGYTLVQDKMAKDVNDRVKRKNPKTRVWGTTSPIRQEKREDLLRHRSSQQVGVIQPIELKATEKKQT